MCAPLDEQGLILGSEKYRHTRKALIGFFANNRCADPEDCADETIKRVLEAASRDEILHLNAFIWNTAEFVRFESIRSSRKHSRQVPIEEAAPEGSDDTERMILLSEILRLVDPFDASLLQKNFTQGREELAKQLGWTRQQLNSRLFAIKEKLRRLMAKGDTAG